MNEPVPIPPAVICLAVFYPGDGLGVVVTAGTEAACLLAIAAYATEFASVWSNGTTRAPMFEIQEWPADARRTYPQQDDPPYRLVRSFTVPEAGAIKR